MDKENRNIPRSRDDAESSRPRHSGDKDSVIQNEVRSMFRYGRTNMNPRDLSKLKEKYNDAKLVDQIHNEYVKQYNQITRQAEKFAEVIVNKYGTARYPMHKVMEKALKYKNELKMSDASFKEFQRLYERKLAGEHLDLYAYRTVIGKALGEQTVEMSEGLTISDAEHGHLQEILKLYKESEPIYNQVMLQSLSYQDCANQALIGEYDSKKHNPANHVHPILMALFALKVPLLDEHMLFANIGYIIKCKYEKRPVDTRPNYELLYDLVKDPNDVVCSVDSAMADLLNRYKLQIKLWQSVLSLRYGQYYGDIMNGFLTTVDNCRTSIYEMPELMYVKDEGAILRRILSAFSLRPTIVSTVPLYGVVSANPHDRMKLVPSLKQVQLISIQFPTNVLHDDTVIKLSDAISQGHWFIENNTLVPKSQSIFYSRDVLFFYVNRRYYNINPVRLSQPYNFVTLPLTTSGFEELNDRPVEYQEELPIRGEKFDLRSIVCVNSIPYGTGDYKLKMISGCSTLLVRSPNYNQDVTNEGYYIYDPVEAAFVDKKLNHTTPVSLIDYSPESITGTEEDRRSKTSFYEKARTSGTIFVYVKRPKIPV